MVFSQNAMYSHFCFYKHRHVNSFDLIIRLCQNTRATHVTTINLTAYKMAAHVNGKFQFFPSFSESHVPAFILMIMYLVSLPGIMDVFKLNHSSLPLPYCIYYDLNWRDYFLLSKLTVSFRIGIISYPLIFFKTNISQ